MKITPSARILSMLGEIDFDPWQCVAELIDNSFDDFTEIVRVDQPWAGGFKVRVSLPGPAKSSDARLEIADTGRGMSRDILELAVRAGWSSNDRYDKLGLFGMGFNVATARLGRRTRILTTRPGDPEWIGVEIDLDEIGDDFEATDITEPKLDPNDHGTRIEISKLDGDRADWLRRNANNLRKTLGSVYAWLLDNRPFELYVQGVRVKPRRHCRWGEDRSITYGAGAKAETIPAYIEINEKYADADACADCGNWQEPDRSTCQRCGGGRLTRRERRLHGWLGVQRHLDKREFGIDFLRNGRKILQWDKRVFDWQNPNDPLSLVDTEYPIELANQGGRLIGEIHLDHVPVVYQKNAFDYGDRGWRAAIDYIRGAGPLQPEKAKRLGYPENDSPLGLLYKGFRRNAVGKRHLIPGDGHGPIHDETRRWAQRFHDGDQRYQTDDLWWEAVESHEARAKRGKLDTAQRDNPTTHDEAAVLEALGLSSGPGSTGGPTGSDAAKTLTESCRPATVPTSRRETSQERIKRLRADSEVIPELSRDFGLARLGHLTVETRRLSSARLVDEDGQTTPVLLVQGPGSSATAFVDPVHDAFVKLGADVTEPLLIEIAAVLRVRADSSTSLSQLVASLRAECLPHTALNAHAVVGEARELLSVIRARMAACVQDEPHRAFQYLSPDEVSSVENDMIANGMVSRTATLGEDGDFVLHAPPLYLVTLLESWPEAFMDGKTFTNPYATLTSRAAARLSLARTAGPLGDVAMLVEHPNADNPLILQRTRLSVRMLDDQLAVEA